MKSLYILFISCVCLLCYLFCMFSSYVYLLMELSDHKHEINIFKCCKIPPNFRMSRVMMPFRLPETNLQKTPTTGLEGISGCNVFPNMKYGKSKGSLNINSRLQKITSTYPRLKILESIILGIYMSFFWGGGVCTKSPEITKRQLPYESPCALSGHHGCGSGWYGSMSWTWYAWHGNLVVSFTTSPWSPWSLGVVDPTLNGMGCITLVNNYTHYYWG